MHLRTKKQKQYFKEVIKLHYEHGYAGERISRILPVSDATVSRWLAIFASENGGKSVPMKKKKAQTQPDAVDSPVNDVKALHAEIGRLQAQLKHEKLRADAYDELINVAESMFKIPIRKKAGAKR
ncbi:MAG: transposase [Tannerellaceae bacterium]|jgi:transposase|nr:transposase [Tannerellaceae bacterium]